MSASAAQPQPDDEPPAELLPASRRPMPLEPPREEPILTVDSSVMQGLAARAVKAGKGGLSAVGVASLRHGEGATTMARSLAVCLATSFRKRVVLVEANLRTPCLASLYRLPAGPGLSDVLAGEARLQAALKAPRGQGTLLVLPASTEPPGNPAALPGEALREVMADLFGYADVLVFDLAPILPYPDTGLLCGSLDGVALVLRAGKARRSDSTRAVRQLRDDGVPILGAVLNRERSFIPRFIERML